MEKTDDLKSIYGVTNQILWNLSNRLDTPYGKAILANLRNSIGKQMSESIEIWPLIFEYLPTKYLSKSGHMTDEEISIIHTLQLYALHQQGLSESVLLTNKEDFYKNMGESLSALRNKENSVSIDRRFNTLITAATYEELHYHLRQMINLLRSREKNKGKVNYSRLAQDLFWFNKGYREDMRIRWARSYYSYYKQKELENE